MRGLFNFRAEANSTEVFNGTWDDQEYSWDNSTSQFAEDAHPWWNSEENRDSHRWRGNNDWGFDRRRDRRGPPPHRRGHFRRAKRFIREHKLACALAVIGVVAAAVYYRKSLKKKEQERRDEENQPQPQPIAVPHNCTCNCERRAQFQQP